MCLFRFALRTDGTVGAHWAYTSTERHQCGGAGKLPQPFDYRGCCDCLVHMYRQPMLVEACYSVSIENGRDPGYLLLLYMTDYHERGHVPAPEDTGTGAEALTA